MEPGFGGQSFMGPKHPTHNVMPKILDVRTRFPGMDIEVDGGLGSATIEDAARAGLAPATSYAEVFPKLYFCRNLRRPKRRRPRTPCCIQFVAWTCST